MRTLLRTLLIATALTATARADFDRTLPTGPNPDLYVVTGSGRIHVYPGPDNNLHITAHVHAGWNAGRDIQERIARISANPPIQQSGNTIHVGDSTADRNLYNNITIDYDIAAPRSVALNLRSGSGDLEVDNLGRFLKAETGSGAVRAHGIAGPADLHTGSGDVELQQSGPGEVKASTGSGSIRINGMASGPLTARTGSGDIEANGTLTGPAKLQSGSGSLRMHLGPGARFDVDASTGSGSIRIDGSNERFHVSRPVNGGGPLIEAHSGSGDIEIN